MFEPVPANDGNELSNAAYEGDTTKVKDLLDQGANANHQRFNDGVTALLMAGQNGHTEVIKLLLAHKAEVNLPTRNGTTVLMMAAENGHIEAVKLLLAHGAEVNVQDYTNGATALFVAVIKDHEEIVKILLAKGADVTLQVRGGITPLVAAKTKPIIQLLEEASTRR
ncbi:MAG: hypothetical protein NPIRA02_15740 [Nitrospirales bacterium]|nr:MAG: hypothetical protein NPIRA02_15740 [Nitrospirales bacterium]